MSTAQLVWLITGASQGFGRRLVHAALSRGDKVIATSRSLEKSQDLVQQAAAHPKMLSALALDVTSERQVIKDVVDEAVGIWGRIDVLVNNAGYGYPGLVEEGGTDWIRLQFETNFFGLMEVTNAVLPHMRSKRKGTLVNMGSRSAWKPEVPFIGPYSASKAAVHAITETLSIELAQFGIRVLLVEPGGFSTEGAYGYPPFQDSAKMISDYDEMRTQAASGFATIRQGIRGDPDKAMNALVDVVRGEGVAQGREWPGYLILGEDVEADIKRKMKKIESVLDTWSDVTRGVNLES
ncbi:NAD(P)-binding protein [Pleurotus eryngii]|uniref:NAD(P)-binding protein n=1 Tax=Pleurotus eryngii TaxID=5323 RepID=A0A9P6A749_PLEER|nr:NAD(P)-binding protein [Pleurotus eryngii]